MIETSVIIKNECQMVQCIQGLVSDLNVCKLQTKIQKLKRKGFVERNLFQLNLLFLRNFILLRNVEFVYKVEHKVVDYNFKKLFSFIYFNLTLI